MRRWSGQGGTAPGACFSAQARWWSWGIGDGGPALPRGWRSRWHAQSLLDDAGARKRIVIIQGASDGRWSVTEWLWNPSLRAATRRWQQQRMVRQLIHRNGGAVRYAKSIGPGARFVVTF